jgi:hypothetical protein
VTGTVTVRPADDVDLYAKLRQIANISSTTAVIGPYSSVALPVELRISDPDTGTRLKTLYVSDARFKIPNIQGQVQQKVNVNFTFTSDGGNLIAYKGSR